MDTTIILYGSARPIKEQFIFSTMRHIFLSPLLNWKFCLTTDSLHIPIWSSGGVFGMAERDARLQTVRIVEITYLCSFLSAKASMQVTDFLFHDMRLCSQVFTGLEIKPLCYTCWLQIQRIWYLFHPVFSYPTYIDESAGLLLHTPRGFCGGLLHPVPDARLSRQERLLSLSGECMMIISLQVLCLQNVKYCQK